MRWSILWAGWAPTPPRVDRENREVPSQLRVPGSRRQHNEVLVKQRGYHGVTFPLSTSSTEATGTALALERRRGAGGGTSGRGTGTYFDDIDVRVGEVNVQQPGQGNPCSQHTCGSQASPAQHCRASAWGFVLNSILPVCKPLPLQV